MNTSLLHFQYLLSTLETALVDLLSFDLIPRRTPNSTKATLSGRDPTHSLRTAIANLEQEILPQAIGLTDAFGFTDWELDRYLFSMTDGYDRTPVL
jgi:acyl-CoA oxidase